MPTPIIFLMTSRLPMLDRLPGYLRGLGCQIFTETSVQDAPPDCGALAILPLDQPHLDLLRLLTMQQHHVLLLDYSPADCMLPSFLCGDHVHYYRCYNLEFYDRTHHFVHSLASGGPVACSLPERQKAYSRLD